MARKNFTGDGLPLGVTRQQNRTINEKNDGQLEGVVEYVADQSLEHLLPLIESRHPDDNNLLMFNRSKTYRADGKIHMTASYIGLNEDPTIPVATYTGGSGQEPITTHPEFIKFAGDPINGNLQPGTGNDERYLIGLNGARFDLNSKQFVGFLDPKNIKAGTNAYFKSGDQIIASYWSFDVPTDERRNRIFDPFPYSNIRVNSDVINWLCIDVSIRQVGLLFNIQEVYLGSDDSEGWDSDIYSISGDPPKTRGN